MSKESDPTPVKRRELLRDGGSLMALLSLAPTSLWSVAATEKDKIYTPPGLQANLPSDAGTYPRGTWDKHGDFDLSDPESYLYAKLKVSGNPLGRTNYLGFRTRHHLCVQGVPATPLVDELELWVNFVEQPKGSDTLIQRASFTRCFIDPDSNDRVSDMMNPVTKRRLDLPYQMFSVSIPLRFTPPVRGGVKRGSVTEYEQPTTRFDDHIDFTTLAARNGEGSHQPSMDSSTWRVNYADLMNAEQPLLRAHNAYTALYRASFLGWTGIDEGNTSQILQSRTGMKVFSVDALPELVKTHLAERFPERL